MTTSPAEVAVRLVKRMATACDNTRTIRGRDEVAVRTRDWHALMDLAEEARSILTEKTNG
jgi:hypothetical protein